MTPTSADGALIAAAVTPAAYHRLLGMPRHRALHGLLAERAREARAWYARHGRPCAYSRRHAIAALGADTVRLEGGREFTSHALAERLRRCNAHAVVGLAVSAGPEIDAACRRLWQDGRHDESYFLERFGVAVAEQLIAAATLGHCRDVAGSAETITPHLSPGCGSWNLGEQRVLWDAIFPAGESGPIRLLESGGLTPQHSMLAAAGVTRQTQTAAPPDACRACDLQRCAFRRAACRRAS